jgi:hypothetical protein
MLRPPGSAWPPPELVSYISARGVASAAFSAGSPHARPVAGMGNAAAASLPPRDLNDTRARRAALVSSWSRAIKSDDGDGGGIIRDAHGRVEPLSSLPSPPAAATAAARWGVLAHYYVWYGQPARDGSWLHWNHSVLAHGSAEVDRRHRDVIDTGEHSIRPAQLTRPRAQTDPPRTPRSSGRAAQRTRLPTRSTRASTRGAAATPPRTRRWWAPRCRSCVAPGWTRCCCRGGDAQDGGAITSCAQRAQQSRLLPSNASKRDGALPDHCSTA